MLHLVGAGSDIHTGKTMAGLDKTKKQTDDYKALQFNKKQCVDEEEGIAELKSEISGLRKMQAKALGDANHIIDGADEEAESEDEKLFDNAVENVSE